MERSAGADVQRILLAGDVHGDTSWWGHLIALARRHRCPDILQLGDFGIWPGPEGRRYLDTLERRLTAAHVRCFFVDGNHEDHPQLRAFPVTADGWRDLRPGLRHAPRGLRWTWAGVQFLALGGTTSLDQEWRLPGRTWWPEEEISDADVELAIAGGTVDVLVTHDAPADIAATLPSVDWVAQVSPDVVEQSHAQERLLQTVVEAVSPRLLVHGHWHLHHDTPLALPGERVCRVIGLACNGQPHSAAVLELPTLAVTVVD